LTDADIEAAISAAWINFLAAVKRDDPAASRLWRKLKALYDQRTPEQKARALVLAGLNADGTLAERKGEARA